jgi:hypothetical protein
VDSRPSGAKVSVDGVYQGVTPLVVKVKSNEAHTLSVQGDAYPEHAVLIEPYLSGVYVWLDFPALFPLLIDALTGAWYRSEPQSIHIILGAPAPSATTRSPAPAPQGGNTP